MRRRGWVTMVCAAALAVTGCAQDTQDTPELSESELAAMAEELGLEQTRIEHVEALRATEFPDSYVGVVAWQDAAAGLEHAQACVEVDDGRVVAHEMGAVRYHPDAVDPAPVSGLPRFPTLTELRDEVLRIEQAGLLKPMLNPPPYEQGYGVLVGEQVWVEPDWVISIRVDECELD